MSVTEWDQRQLCPDGGCTGVIGPDGQCKVCGRVAPNWGDERKRGLVEEISADAATTNADDDEDAEYDDDDDFDDDDDGEDGDSDHDDDEPDEGDTEGVIAAKAAAPTRPKRVPKGSGEWSQRELCSDGSCVGVIGDDGRCKVCGKPPAGTPG